MEPVRLVCRSRLKKKLFENGWSGILVPMNTPISTESSTVIDAEKGNSRILRKGNRPLKNTQRRPAKNTTPTEALEGTNKMGTTEDHLGPCQDSDNSEPVCPDKASEGVTGRTMSLTQCYCDGCNNSFYVGGNSIEYLPKQCCYCGALFGEVEEIEEVGEKDDDNEQWGYELFA